MQVQKIEKLLDTMKVEIEAAISEAYERGKVDAKAEMLALLSSSGGGGRVITPPKVDDLSRSASETHNEERFEDLEVSDEDDVEGRKRAPRGLPRALATRVLLASEDGVTPSDILDFAESDYERMIKVSSIRAELRKGEAEGRYIERGGLWFPSPQLEMDEMFT